MNISAAFAIVATLFAAIPAASARGARMTEKRDPTPLAAQSFAAGVLERAYAGWHIGQVAFRYPGSEEIEVEVIMVDAARTQAQAFQWIIPEDGQGKGAYHVMRAEVPDERRVYDGEQAFLDLLASDPPATVVMQPGNVWLFRGQRTSAALGEDRYHMVVRHIGGNRAPAALASALISVLEQDGTLIAVDAGSPESGRSDGFTSVDFVVWGDELQVIHAMLDGRGQVVAVQLRRPGVRDPYESYAQNSELLDSLRAGKSVRRIVVHRDGRDLVTIGLVLENDVRATIDTGDFYEEELIGC